MVVANAPVDIAALKARHSLGDAVEAAGVRLRGRGRVRQGVCPFHDEAEASFTVYSDTVKFYCFGCGEGGDVLDFIQHTEGQSLPEAIRKLDGGGGLAPAPGVRSRAAFKPRRPSAAVVPPRDPAPLTASGRSQPIPTRKGRLQPGAALLLCPQGRNPKATQREGGRDDNGNIGNWQSDDGDGGKAPAQPRRAGRPGDVDGALAVLAGMDATKAEPHQARWAFAEWTDLVRRRFGDRDVLVYSQGAGQAAALAPTGNGGTLEVAAVLGMRWRPGKVVSERSLRGLRPLAKACPRP